MRYRYTIALEFRESGWGPATEWIIAQRLEHAHSQLRGRFRFLSYRVVWVRQEEI